MSEENREKLWWWVSFFLAILVMSLCLWIAHDAVTVPSSPYLS
jgi:hypothetical protein